jgi:hypothetical protein
METKKLHINVPTLQQSFPLIKLKRVENNRQIIDKNVQALKERILDVGFIGSITVTGSGYILDGQHRALAMKELGQTKIPATVLNWVDEKDKKLVSKIIIALNNTGKVWTAQDYVEHYKDDFTPYHHVHKAFNQYLDGMTANTITESVVGLGGGTKPFKDGEAELKNTKVSEALLLHIKSILDKYGKTNFPTIVSRNVIRFIHAHCDGNLSLIGSVFNKIEKAIQEGTLPDGDKSIIEWLNNVAEVWEHNFDKKVDPHINNIKVLSEQIKFKA